MASGSAGFGGARGGGGKAGRNGAGRLKNVTAAINRRVFGGYGGIDSVSVSRRRGGVRRGTANSWLPF